MLSRHIRCVSWSELHCRKRQPARASSSGAVVVGPKSVHASSLQPRCSYSPNGWSCPYGCHAHAPHSLSNEYRKSRPPHHPQHYTHSHVCGERRGECKRPIKSRRGCGAPFALAIGESGDVAESGGARAWSVATVASSADGEVRNQPAAPRPCVAARTRHLSGPPESCVEAARRLGCLSVMGDRKGPRTEMSL